MDTPRKIVTTCALAAASALGASEAAAFTDQEKATAYFQSDYQYCDARKIAAVWGRDVYGGKLVIGGKILSGLTHLADADIESTGRSVYCEWQELGLSYDDAVKLANFWGRSVSDAKSKAMQMASDTGARAFRLRMAHALR